MSAEPYSRQRLRPWLIGQLDNSSIPGLKWLPNSKGECDRTKFRIPWKHGGKHDWTPDQSRVFKEWAVHTGKFREGVDDEQFAKWKTNLRCALNKAKDIHEITEESQKESENPFKVYRFLPRKVRPVDRIHKNNYAEKAPTNAGVGRTDLPAHIACYSSSSLSSRSMPSGPFKGMAETSPIAENATQQLNNYTEWPSDLLDLRSDSLRDVTQDLSSFDANCLKDELMDCDDGSQSSDGIVASGFQVPLHQSQLECTEQHIKQEMTDPLTQCTQPSVVRLTSALQEAASVQRPTMFEEHLLNMTEPYPPHLNGQTTGSEFFAAVSSPQSVGRGSECSDNSRQSFMNTAPSPAYSNASSSFIGTYGSPSPSPTQHFMPVPSPSPPNVFTTVSQPLNLSTPFPTVSQASPPHIFTAISEASSPTNSTISQAHSPHMTQYAGNGHMVNGDATPREMNMDPCTKFVDKMAGLDVKDSMRPYHTLMNQYANNRCGAEVDIGHKCMPTPNDCAMTVQVLYKSRVVIHEHVTGSAGCFIAYNPITEHQGRMLDEVGLSVIKEKVYDQQPGRLEIALPEWQTSDNPKLDREVHNLLKNAGRGIVVECNHGDIYVKRLCKTSVYYATHFDNEQCTKLNRHDGGNERLKIFDFNNVFMPAMQQFALDGRNAKNEVKHPNPEVCLFIGQNGSPSNAHTRYVVIKISSCKASSILKTMERSLYSLSAEVSNSDSLDKIDDTLRKEFNNHAA